MTEAASSITFRLLRAPEEAPATRTLDSCVGVPAPALEVCVARTDPLGPGADAADRGRAGEHSGRAAGGQGVPCAAPDEEGEIFVRGGQIFSGYWADPKASAEALPARPVRMSRYAHDGFSDGFPCRLLQNALRLFVYACRFAHT